MHPHAKHLFFTNKATIWKDWQGNPIEIEGVFFNWLGRNVPYVVIGAWVVLVLIFQLFKA